MPKSGNLGVNSLLLHLATHSAERDFSAQRQECRLYHWKSWGWTTGLEVCGCWSPTCARSGHLLAALSFHRTRCGDSCCQCDVQWPAPKTSGFRLSHPTALFFQVGGEGWEMNTHPTLGAAARGTSKAHSVQYLRIPSWPGCPQLLQKAPQVLEPHEPSLRLQSSL